MTPHPSRTNARRLVPVATAIAIAIVAALAVSTRRVAQPTLISDAARGVTRPSLRDGSWYWIEQRDPSHAVLVRVDATKTKHDISSAEQIDDYAIAPGHIFVISRNGKTWQAALADMDGGQIHEVWSGNDQPHGAVISGDSVYWMRPKPALIPDAGAFPPLGPQCEVMSSPLAGGESHVITTIMEPKGDEVIGAAGGAVWLSAERPGTQNATTIYRVSVADGETHRVVGETGLQSAVLTTAGVLYWTAPSREAQNFGEVICIRRLGESRTTETLNEWLPAGGRLFDTRHGPCYVDGTYAPRAWPVTAHADLPTPVRVADGYVVLAAADDDLLLRPKNDPQQKSPIYLVGNK